MSNICSNICSEICYEFSAVAYPPDAVALYVTVRGVPYDLTPPHIRQVWHDVQVCFTHAGYPRVAAILGRLQPDWNGVGTFIIKGPPAPRQEVFDLLSRDFSPDHKAGRPHTVSMEFHQSHTPPQLVIHAHHGMIYSWRVDDIPLSPIFHLQIEEKVEEEEPLLT